MYRLICTILICSCSTISAAFPLCGPYAGLQLGETSNHYSLSMLGLQSATVHYEGFSGRAYLGYQLNRYIGIESGFLRFTPAKLHTINGVLNLNGRIRDYSVDALLAANFPLPHNYFIFGKFGVAYHFAKPSHSIRAMSTNDYAESEVAHYRPMTMLGIGYAINRHVGIDASYTQVFRHRMMPKGTLWALGVSYYL
jgi:hypothetical protein